MYSITINIYRYAFLKPATHYQIVAQTRHWTELGGWRSKVGKGVSKSGHLTPNTYPIQTSDQAGRRKKVGWMLVRTSLIKCGDSEHWIRHQIEHPTDLFFDLLRKTVLRAQGTILGPVSCSVFELPHTIGLPTFNLPSPCLSDVLFEQMSDSVWPS